MAEKASSGGWGLVEGKEGHDVSKKEPSWNQEKSSVSDTILDSRTLMRRELMVYDFLNGAFMKAFSYRYHQGSRRGAHQDEITSVIYVKQHKVVITASWDRNICVHDEDNNEEGILLRTMSGACVRGVKPFIRLSG